MKNNTQHEDASFLQLLQQWWQGNFRHSDEQKLRELSQSDAFRRDAMAGYQTLPTEDHEVNLAHLRKRLPAPAVLKMRPLWRQQILAAAAILLILMTAVWFFQEKNPTEPNFAQNLPAAESPNFETKNAPVEDEVAAVEPIPTSGSPAKFPTIAAAPPAPKVGANKLEKIPASAPEKEKAATKEIAHETATLSSDLALSPPEERVLTRSTPPAAALPRQERSDVHQTDQKPNLDAIKESEDLPAFAGPTSGWDTFNQYIRQNAQLPPDAKPEHRFGVVTLQFQVMPNGEPGGIQIIRSLCPSCDEEAKRLVRLFDWQRGKNNLVKIDIQFSR